MVKQAIMVNGQNIEIFLPDAEYIRNLREGDLAQDCFGQWRVVDEIFARGTDIKGRAYVCFYTELTPGQSRISGSYKEREINRTVALCGALKSVQIDTLERELANMENGYGNYGWAR